MVRRRDEYFVPKGAPRRLGNVRRSRARQSASPRPPRFVTELVWSPDGGRIAYPTAYDGIFVGHPDAAEARKLCDARSASRRGLEPPQ
jgi:hypothetical protein